MVFWRLDHYESVSWYDLFLARPVISGCKAAVIFLDVKSRLWLLLIDPMRNRTQETRLEIDFGV